VISNAVIGEVVHHRQHRPGYCPDDGGIYGVENCYIKLVPDSVEAADLLRQINFSFETSRIMTEAAQRVERAGYGPIGRHIAPLEHIQYRPSRDGSVVGIHNPRENCSNFGHRLQKPLYIEYQLQYVLELPVRYADERTGSTDMVRRRPPSLVIRHCVPGDDDDLTHAHLLLWTRPAYTPDGYFY
jgi:hypothetical protein